MFLPSLVKYMSEVILHFPTFKFNIKDLEINFKKSGIILVGVQKLSNFSNLL